MSEPIPIIHTICHETAFYYDHPPERMDRMQSKYATDLMGERIPTGAMLKCGSCGKTLGREASRSWLIPGRRHLTWKGKSW